MDDSNNFHRVFFLRTWDTSMGVQARNTLLCVGNCDNHLQDPSFIRHTEVVYYPTHCTSTLEHLSLGIIKSS